MKVSACFIVFLFFTGGVILPAATTQQIDLPAPGEWDGKTEKAKLERAYEDPLQAYVPFGLSSYFLMPWRAYMDTQPASHFLGSMAFNMNSSPDHADAVLQVMSEAGIRKVRYEIGWGNLDWNDALSADTHARIVAFLQSCTKYGVRPMFLLNANSGQPCPVRNVPVTFVAEAKKGDRSFKVRPEDVAKIRVNYTGPFDVPQGCAALPLVIQTSTDGTCQLSGPLGEDIKVGSFNLCELKYRPFHGVKEKGADDATNAELAASDQETMDGWKRYVAVICDVALEGLVTKGKPDAGFDCEVWNEMTFGSNFLDLNNYYDPKLDFTEPLIYEETRLRGPGMRPDAVTHFKADGCWVILPITVNYVRSRPELATVNVDNGLCNQEPFTAAADSWPGENAYSRHYYTGGWVDITPQTVPHIDIDTINALGKRDGKRPEHPHDWNDIVVGSNFIPTVRLAFPELAHCGYHTETLSRDVLPDSRWSDRDTAMSHGRFIHNGDYHLQELWQTEVNDDRLAFFDDLFKKSKMTREDPRAYALDSYMAGKMELRQYLFHNHKGLRNLYMFACEGGPYEFTFLEPPFFAKLDAAGGKVTDDVRSEVPSCFKGLGWLTRQMEAADPIVATRALRVDELWEYKPRLMYAGDGTPEHPNQWNRDWFAFLPYQLTANKFVVPYYVVTVDAFKAWDTTKDLFDPMRYQMPDQDFDVTIGNCAGKGAKVSVYDPMTNLSVPVDIVDDKTSATQLTVKLKTTDYPRFLVIEEASPGPLIQNPKMTADEKGTLHLEWDTNIKVDQVKISFGRDWPNRGATERSIHVAEHNLYGVDFSTGLKGILAARVSISANGLTCTWPRWDQDIQGQVVIPGAGPGDVTPLIFGQAPADFGDAATTAVPLVTSKPAILPVVAANAAYRYQVRLPQGVSLSGPPENQESFFGDATDPVHLRARYLADANLKTSDSTKSPVDALLPFTAVGDETKKTVVTLPSAQLATLVDMTLLPALHPGEKGIVQKLLFIPSGNDNADFIALTASGSPQAMKDHADEILSIFTTYQWLEEKK